MPDYDVFLSYNWRDHETVEGVARELTARKLRVFLDRWYLTPGRSWRRELEEKLEQSAGVVIFLGPNNLGNWQERELDVALDRQGRGDEFPVIPVLLPGSDPALGFLGMNTWVDMRDGVQGPSLDALDAAIRGQPAGTDSPSTATLLASDVAPYRGLRPFREEDADFFYGREAFTETLVDAVDQQTFVAVVGPSGSGKSSVVHAGLLPRLRRAGDGPVWEVTTLVPGQRPLHALAASLVGLLEPELTERFVEVARLAEGLASGTVDFADVVARVLEKQEGTDRLLIVIDQWEELYALTTDDAARRGFIDALLTATEGQSPLTVVLTLRGDFVGTALGYRPLSDRLQGAQVNLSTMTAEETERAMMEPARKVGLEFEPGLVTRILDDIGDEPGTLPLLEFVLTELWRDRARGRLLHSTYESIGGVQGAMAARADEVVSGLPAGDQERVRRLLLHLVQPGAGTTDTRRRATIEELGTESEPIVRELASSRLLVTGRDEATGEETVEVAHEALIQHWGRLREWVDRDREFLMWRRRIESSLGDWEATDRDDGSLLHGVALAEAERWHSERAEDLGRAECDFVERSVALHEAEIVRDRRRRRFLGAAAAAVMAVLAVFAVVAVRQWQSAQSAQSEAEAALVVAESRELAARANDAALTSPQLALLLAAEAYQLSPTFESRDAMARGQAAWTGGAISFGDPLTGHQGWVLGVAYSPDGETLASAGQDHIVRLWDVATRTSIGELRGHTDWVLSVAFSPDGETLASAGGDGTVRLWDVATRQLIGEPLTLHTDNVWSVAFSPDGAILASGSHDRTVRLWDVATRQPIGEPLMGHRDNVWSVAFSPDGAILASGSIDRTVRLWDVATRQPIANNARPSAFRPDLLQHTEGVLSVAFSPDGATLASGGSGKTVLLWDVATGRPIGDPLSGHTGSILSVAFSSSGGTLASAGNDRTVRLWDVGTRQLIGEPLRHTATVHGVAFSPTRSLRRGLSGPLVSASEDGTVRLWAPPDHQPLRGDPLTGHTSAVLSVAFSPPDGAILASASDDGTVRLWDASTWEPLGEPLRGHTEDVLSVAFSPDGATLVSAGGDWTVRLWDVATRQPLGDPLRGHDAAVRSVAFSPDGATLASAGTDGTVRLWDAATRQSIRDPMTGHTKEERPGHEAVNSVTFSPDGATLASAGDDGTVRLWDVATSQPIGESLEHGDSALKSVAFSPDGATLASAALDGTVRLWDVATRQPIGEPLRHIESVFSVAFSPDGATLASAGEGWAVRLWDVASRRPLGDPLIGRDGREVYGVAFSPDGVTLSSGTGKNEVELWDTPTFAAACGLATSAPLPSIPEFLEERTDHWACEELATSDD